MWEQALARWSWNHISMALLYCVILELLLLEKVERMIAISLFLLHSDDWLVLLLLLLECFQLSTIRTQEDQNDDSGNTLVE